MTSSPRYWSEFRFSSRLAARITEHTWGTSEDSSSMEVRTLMLFTSWISLMSLGSSVRSGSFFTSRKGKITYRADVSFIFGMHCLKTNVYLKMILS